jgi:hypothetical protein
MQIATRTFLSFDTVAVGEPFMLILRIVEFDID